MTQLEVVDTVDNSDQTEALIHQPPQTVENVLDSQATVLMKSVYRSSYEYVIGFDGADQPIAITFCETDDQETIQTDYDLEDFVAEDDDEPESINTLVFSQADGETLTQLFAQYTVE